jgi:hypothetical protein
MRRGPRIAAGLALCFAALAKAQEPPESLPGLQAAQSGQSEAQSGPTPVDQVKLLHDLFRWACNKPEECDPVTGKQKEPCIKTYGWLDFGYTYSSSGHGPLSVEPRPNHFGDEFTLNQIALAIEKPLDPKELSWGFVVLAYGGSDAALLNPIRGAIVEKPDPRFGFDFRDLYLQAHLPILTEGGVDIQAGQHHPLIGYQSAMAPYRTFYSNDYQWFYSKEGSFTGIVIDWHVNPKLDVISSVQLGYITFFDRLSVSPTYVGQVNYWLQPEKKTQISLGFITGPESPHSGAPTTLGEFRVLQNWNRCLTQIVEFNAGYSERGIFVPGLERYYALYNLLLYHLTPRTDVNFRVGWYDDVDGRNYPGGTGFRNNYEEITLGLDYHPYKWLQVRPEVRGDFANNTPAFGPVGGALNRSQFTAAIEWLIKF